jgi:hypothetical protein
MKKVIIALLLLISACSGETAPVTPPAATIDINQLYGRWRYDDIQVSSSQLAEIQQALGRVIEYRRDSTYTLPVSSFSSNGRFRILDSNRISMDRGFFDGQIKDVTELTATVFRAGMQVRSDDGGTVRVVGTATFRLSKQP